MDTSLKQRLVGAAVLVALAVIFLPMLVKGPAPDSGAADVPLSMPATPNTGMETRELPLAGPADAPAGGAVGMPIDDGAEIVVRMQRLRDGAEGHDLVDWHPAERPVHRRRPMDVSARQIPSPHGASRQSFGEVTRNDILLFARFGRGEIPDAAAKEREHEAGANEQCDFEARVAPPAGERGMHGLK